MTKTEAKRKVAALRRAAARITDALTPTPEWIAAELNTPQPTPEQTARLIRAALDEVEALAADLRAGLLTEGTAP